MAQRKPPLEIVRLLSPAEAAQVTGLRSVTLAKMAEHGLISCTRTLGGHRRYLESDALRIGEEVRRKKEHRLRKLRRQLPPTAQDETEDTDDRDS